MNAEQLAELREKSSDELQEQLNELYKERFNCRMRHATGQLPQSHLLGEVRRDIAQVKTVLNEIRQGRKVQPKKRPKPSAAAAAKKATPAPAAAAKKAAAKQPVKQAASKKAVPAKKAAAKKSAATKAKKPTAAKKAAPAKKKASKAGKLSKTKAKGGRNG